MKNLATNIFGKCIKFIINNANYFLQAVFPLFKTKNFLQTFTKEICMQISCSNSTLNARCATTIHNEVSEMLELES